MPEETSSDWIWQVARGFMESRILLTAAEYDLFSHLERGANTVAQVASAAGVHPRSADAMLHALAAMEFVEKQEERFVNTPLAKRFLVADAPDSVLPSLLHSAHMWQTWSTLSEVMQAGTRVYRRPPEAQPAATEAFIGAMHRGARERASSIVPQVDLEGVENLLDVGGGAGSYAIEFARRKHGLQAVVLDLPDVVPIAERTVAQAGMGDRITTRVADFLRDDLGSGFDLAFLSSIIHQNSPDENRLLLGKVAAALEPGGQVAIVDFIMEEDRLHPRGGAIFAMNMLVATGGGGTYTEREVRSWLEECGFGEMNRSKPAGDASLITARLAR